jgi:hypothetical protein
MKSKVEFFKTLKLKDFELREIISELYYHKVEQLKKVCRFGEEGN